MHLVCCCSLPVWRRSFLKKGTPRDLFWPRPGSAPGGIWPKNNNTCKGPWVLHSYQVSSKSIKRFWRRSRKCESLRTTDDGRTDDGRCAMTIAHSSLRLRWAKNGGKSAMLMIFPCGDQQWKGQFCNAANLSPGGKCLQCCRSSEGKVCKEKICNTKQPSDHVKKLHIHRFSNTKNKDAIVLTLVSTIAARRPLLVMGGEGSTFSSSEALIRLSELPWYRETCKWTDDLEIDTSLIDTQFYNIDT